MFDFVVEGRCGEGALLRSLRPRADVTCAHVDLGRLAFCEPLGLVAVAAFAEHAVRTGEVRVTAPADPSVARYLARMRLGRVLTGLGVAHDLPGVRDLLFAVADAGVGVLATLRRAGARDAREALGLAVTEGVTARPGGGGGVGLSGIVASLGALGGHLHLVSGDAALTVGAAGRRDCRAAAALAGTAVQGLVRRRAAG